MSLQSNLQKQVLQVPQITVGVVVDTNDPQQMGRLRVLCPALNDRDDAPREDVPWASYVAPFGGDVQVGTRGPDGSDIKGPTGYGMWAIPKVGAQVVVMCLDGRTDHRLWMGCIYGQLLPHTMPHGRFTFNEQFVDDDEPTGPLDSYERAIEPLSANLKEAFPNPGGDNYEYQTRAADFQVAGIDAEQIAATFSELDDDADVPIPTPNSNLTTSRQGYALSRIDPDLEVDENITSANFDNMVTALVSAGFHAISMDDRPENGRMRFRTTSGHQIILDDTNERIYISTAKGKNWVEIDQQGNIDIYTEGKMSVNAELDINFSTQGSFRVNAEKGIHLNSGKQTRITSAEDIAFDTSTTIRGRATETIVFETSRNDISFRAQGSINNQSLNGDINLVASGSLRSAADSDISFDAGSRFIAGASSTINLGAGSNVVVKGSRIDLNGASPSSPIEAFEAAEAKTNPDFLAFLPNRKPEHEPWARIDSNDEGEPFLQYADAKINKVRYYTGDNGETSSSAEEIARGAYWRR